MRITTKGQVTIPQHIRESAGLRPGADVDFQIVDGVVQIVPSQGSQSSRGQLIVESLRGKGNFGMTTDEVIELMRGPPAEV